MKRVFSFIILFLLIVVIILAVAKNMIAQTVVSKGVKALTGLGVTMEEMNVGILNTSLGIKELKVYNPSGFPEALMLSMPEIYVDYDLWALLKKKVHLKEVRLNLTEFIVVKDKEGRLNLDSLKVVKEQRKKPAPEEKPKEKGAALGFQIDVLNLKIGKVYFKDYSKGDKPEIKEYTVNIEKEYKNITNPKTLVSSIVLTALTKTTINQLTDLNLSPLTEELTGTLKKTMGLATGTAEKAVDVGKEVGGAVGGAAKDVLEETTEAVTDVLKKIIPFGK